jgi:hypothetical protein
MTLRLSAAVWMLVAVATGAAAQGAARKPAVPTGTPTRGFAIGLLIDGIDYTKPAIAARLARDGEGVAIAYDAVDDDARPYGTDAAAEASVLLAPTLVVPIRVAATDDSTARAFAFVRRSPARVVAVLVPLAAGAVAKEAAATPDRLVIVAAGDAPKLALSNVLTVATLPSAGAPAVRRDYADIVLAPPSATREAPTGQASAGPTTAREAPTGQASTGPTTAREAALLATGLFACLDLSKARQPSDVIAAIVARGAKGPAGTAPLVEVCAKRF